MQMSYLLIYPKDMKIMLSEDDKYMLNAIIETNANGLEFGMVDDTKTQLERIEWLSGKLKETNDELVKEKLITENMNAVIGMLDQSLNDLRGKYNELKVETEGIPPAEIVIVNPSYGRIIP